MTTFIEVHALQTMPPSNINRDESGSPKTAVYGGVVRARVSSQAWKQAMRKHFETSLDPELRGVRTLRVLEALLKQMGDAVPDQTAAIEQATEVLKAAGIGVKAPRAKKGEAEPGPEKFVSEALVFLSNQQLRRLAEMALSDEPIDKKKAKEAADQDHGVEVGLFGRMVASSPDLNVDAAVQVAHAISTHEVEPQADFYTAVDDFKRANDEDDSGAGMMGTIEFNSSTLYRYGVVDVDQLQRNIGSAEVTAQAAGTFVRSFIESMPTGKQNTFAGQSRPEFVLVRVRTDRPLSLANAFEEAVADQGRGHFRGSVAKLADHAQRLEAAYGGGVSHSWLVSVDDHGDILEGLGDRVSLDTLAEKVEQEALRQVGESA
ncbi:MAG: type I-E CRISPR-associated protein Cas7/Cse4/CasC [Propionibacteriales bacterium]|nr:type I-E CRISPR-associated protein Cas7/Cse4/CasC [Propionibacteriales bacterium]